MSNKEIPYKIYLEENEMPDSWYNVRADMKKKPAPLLNPATLEPLKPEELEPVFCKELVKQELNDTDAYIPIPQEIKDFYKMYRPSPLVRAYCLRSLEHLQRFIINLKEIIQVEVTSLILRLHRLTMQSSRD